MFLPAAPTIQIGATYFPGATDQSLRFHSYGFDGDFHPLTQAVWLFPQGSISGNPYIGHGISMGAGPGFGWGWRLYNIDSGDRMLAFRDGSRYAAWNATVDWNSWHHYSYSDAGGDRGTLNYPSDNITPYKDGISVGLSSSSGGSASEISGGGPYDLSIGNRGQPEFSDGGEYEGSMAHYAVWRRELSPREHWLLGNGHSPLYFPNGLVFYSQLSGSHPVDLVHNITGIADSVDIGSAWNYPFDTKVRQPTWLDDPIFWLLPAGLAETTLVVADLSQANTVSKPTTTKETALAVDNLSQTNTVDKVTTTKETALAIDNLSQDSAVDKPALTQVHNLSLQDLTQANLVEPVILELTPDLEPFNLSQSSVLDSIILEPSGSVVPWTLEQQNTISVPALTQTHVLGMHNLSQSSLVEKPFVNTEYQLGAIDISQANVFSVPTLTQIHNLTGLELSQSSFIQLVYLGEWWYERHEDIGLATITYSVVGYTELVHEEYALIDQEYDIDAYIDQQLDGDGEIAQEHGQDALVAVTYEQDGEI